MHRIVDIISLSATYLKNHGISHARLNAELLLGHVLGKSRIDLYLAHDRPVVEEELAALRKLLKDRATHKPVQYILGKTEFFSLPFAVTEGVFIPRPETEILVEDVIDFLRSSCEADQIVVYDVGTGSGCIAVSIAENIPNCHVYASDISPEALLLAERNAAKNGVADRLTVLRGDLFEPFGRAHTPKADVIVSNPPYIAEDDWDSLPDEVKGFEPRESLLSGSGGLEFLERFIRDAASFLKPQGRISVEIGESQADAVAALMKEQKNYVDIGIRKDYNGADRVVFARLSTSNEPGSEGDASPRP